MIQRARGAKRIAFVSSYSPRKWGIATFASDLIGNVTLAGAHVDSLLQVLEPGEEPVKQFEREVFRASK